MHESGFAQNPKARALLNVMLRHGDIVATDHAGRTLLQIAVGSWTLDQLAAFDVDATDLEDSDNEPDVDQEPDGPTVILDFVPPKRTGQAARMVQAVALALLRVTMPGLEAHPERASVGGASADVNHPGVAAALPRLPQGPDDFTGSGG